MAEHNQQFDDFQQWVSKASSWLTRHEDYHDGLFGRGDYLKDFRAVCFDSKGRICKAGADFHRARDENAFPVHWYWPDQVGEILLAHKYP